jgi:hypothetical protein
MVQLFQLIRYNCDFVGRYLDTIELLKTNHLSKIEFANMMSKYGLTHTKLDRFFLLCTKTFFSRFLLCLLMNIVTIIKIILTKNLVIP